MLKLTKKINKNKLLDCLELLNYNFWFGSNGIKNIKGSINYRVTVLNEIERILDFKANGGEISQKNKSIAIKFLLDFFNLKDNNLIEDKNRDYNVYFETESFFKEKNYYFN